MSWRRSIACVVPITLLASALVLIEAPPVASQEPVAKKEVTLEESAAEAKRLGRLALCAGTEGKERESCLVACGDGWPLLEKCADWRRFGDVGFKLLQKAKKGDDAKALEASAIKAGMAPEEARHLRWYASLEYNLLDPDLLPKIDMADQVMAKNIDGLLYGPSEFEVSAGLHQTGRYKKSADIYAMIFKLLKDELGENHYRTVRVASKAGKYAWYAGDEMKALEYMGAASRGANAIFPEGHPWRAEANLYHQAILHIIEPGPKTSLDVLEQAQRRINATYGQDHLRATRAQMLFGRALAARGEIPRARQTVGNPPHVMLPERALVRLLSPPVSARVPPAIEQISAMPPAPAGVSRRLLGRRAVVDDPDLVVCKDTHRDLIERGVVHDRIRVHQVSRRVVLAVGRHIADLSIAGQLLLSHVLRGLTSPVDVDQLGMR